MTKPIKLITIPFSHYCEKARWALDRVGVAYQEEGHLPVFHYLATFRVGARRTVPALVDGKTVVRDSTDIIAWCDAKKPGSLIPLAGADEALAIEDDLDDHFGPHTRRWAYFHLLPNRAADEFIVAGVPRWEKALLKTARPLAVGYLKRSLKIDEAGAARSHSKIEKTFARVSEIMRDGRRYLTGDRFTVADLTFASLASPVLLPPQHPAWPLSLDLFPSAGADQVEKWRETPAGQYGMRLYAQERAVLPKAA